MSVNSPYFWLAFAPFLLLYRRFATEPARGSHLWILGFSAAFLCLRSPWTLVAITLLGAAVFYGALHIESLQPGSAVRRRWAGGLILLCLAVLVGSRLPSVWNVMGASFFVFQLIAYVADVASGANRAEGDFGSYLSSIGCFAYLTAGPIVRLPQLLPQLRGPEVVDYSGSAEAVFRIVNGLAKKTAADLLTYPDACDTYERRCMLAMLGRALSLLNERERQIVTWHYYDGLTLREIGERIGISQTRTFQLRAQALGHLRGLLAPHETLFDL